MARITWLSIKYRLQRDYSAYADLQYAQQVMEQLPRRFSDYNEMAPHKGLKMISTRQYLRIINGNEVDRF